MKTAIVKGDTDMKYEDLKRRARMNEEGLKRRTPRAHIRDDYDDDDFGDDYDDNYEEKRQSNVSDDENLS